MPSSSGRLRLTAAIVAVAGLLPPQVSAQELVVRSDARIELVSALFRAGGRPEYSRGRVPIWNAALDSLVAANADHPALGVVRRLAGEYNVGFFAPLSLAVHLDAGTLELGAGLARAPSLHRTWTTFPDSTAAFIGDFASFSRDARFDALLAAHRGLLDAGVASLRELLQRQVDPDWFRGFWGDTSLRRISVVPGLVTATASYGLDVVRPDGSRDGIVIIGVGAVDANGAPLYGDSDATTLIHELNHPFVTGVLRRAPASLRAVADSLHRPIVAAMRRIGYGSADAMLNEALVRAAVVRYLATQRGADAAAHELQAQVTEGFTFLPAMVEAYAEYERGRAQYPEFGAFLPALEARLRTAIVRVP